MSEYKNKNKDKPKKDIKTDNKTIKTTNLEKVALKRLSDYLVKNNLSILDLTLEQIRNKYTIFKEDKTKKTSKNYRSDEELQIIIAEYFGFPVSVLKENRGIHFDVDDNYEGITRGYIRVSSEKESEKQDTARQRRDLIKLGVQEEYIYEDYASGTRDDRKEFNRMLRESKTLDTIICTEMSRLGRNTMSLIKLMEFVKNNKMCLKAGSLTYDYRNKEADAMTIAMSQLISVFAELERNLISERTKSALRVKKEKGVRLGRPEMTVDELPDSFVRFYQSYRDRKKLNNKMTQQDLANICNCGNRDTIGRYIKIAQKFEEESGELLEVFRERIKDESKFKEWKMEQSFKLESRDYLDKF